MEDFQNLPDTRAGDFGGVHINSGIPNKAFYLVATAIGGDAWDAPGHLWSETLTRATNAVPGLPRPDVRRGRPTLWRVKFRAARGPRCMARGWHPGGRRRLHPARPCERKAGPARIFGQRRVRLARRVAAPRGRPGEGGGHAHHEARRR